MITKNRRMVPDIDADPFGERSTMPARKDLHLMGGLFHFESNSPELLYLVDAAYADLPNHQFSSTPPDFRVKLMVTPTTSRRQIKHAHASRRPEPVPISMFHGAGLLGATTASSTFVAISPAERTAIICVPRAMLRFPYHIRYELIEFAVFTLASRALHLVSLHAACVGINGRGILLMGPSGAGKSTVALHCLLSEFDFLAEDSVFVAPKTMHATGTPNFLHVRADTLSWLGRSRESALIRTSPVIRRRSGIEKFELDLRRKQFRLAKKPLKIVAVAFLSSRTAGKRPLLRSLPKVELRAKLADMQAYGASLPLWREFSRNISRLGGFEVRRGLHPIETVQALRSLLDGG